MSVKSIPDEEAGLSFEHRFRKAWVIANPTAGGVGSRWRLERAVHLLRERIPVDAFRWTRRRGDAEQWAREASGRGVDLVVASGGDGTLNEIINGLARTDVVLGILPSGTANVVACELNIPRHPVQAVGTLLGGKVERLHLGMARFAPLPGQRSSSADRIERYFFFGAGLGFDSYIVHHLNWQMKRLTRKGTYILCGLNQFFHYEAPRLHVALDGGPDQLCSMAIFSNTRFYAGRFFISPDASLIKPELDACLFLSHGHLDLVRYLWGIFRGSHLAYPDVKCFPMRAASITAENQAYIHLDGDTLGTSPAEVCIERDALSVITPPDWPASTGK